MDFLDPKKERRHRLMLVLGYGLIALGIGIATLILLYQSYGYGVDRRGNVMQNGLVFVSSQPNGAAIFLNNTRYKVATNTRMSILAGSYNLKITAPGYRDWERPIVVAGGDVQHFDYPFLFPNELKTSSLQELSADPTLATQSLDRRWILVGIPGSPGKFTLYDGRDPKNLVATSLALPAGIWDDGDGAQTWKMVEWASDNRHVLVQHTFVSGTTTTKEYLLIDRGDVTQSVNLTTNLKLTQDIELTLFNNRISQFYALNTSEKSLSRINGSDNTVVSKLDHVIAFKSYSDNKILYVSDQSPTGKETPNLVSVVLQDGQKSITLRTLPPSQTYALNLAQYDSNWYVVVGASSDSAVFVYKNPQTQDTSSVDVYPAAWRRLNLSSPNSVLFSSNTQYVMAQSGQNFVVYDFENMNHYRYASDQPMDSPQTHATWMDGNRITYTSGGKIIVFDYDHRNLQTLVEANAGYLPFFSQDFTYLYAFAPASASAKPFFSSTPLEVAP